MLKALLDSGRILSVSWRSRRGGGDSRTGPDERRSRSGVLSGASDVEKTAVGRTPSRGNRAGGGRAPGEGSELRGWCIASNLSRAPGVLRALGISTPASDGPAERAGDRL